MVRIMQYLNILKYYNWSTLIACLSMHTSCLSLHTSILYREHCRNLEPLILFNPIALRKAKIVYNFGLSECNRVNSDYVSHICKMYSLQHTGV